MKSLSYRVVKSNIFRSDFRYVTEYFAANRKAKEGQNPQYNISLNHLKHTREFAELMNAITSSDWFSEIPNIIDERGDKEVFTVMFDQAEARGLAIGEARGIAIGEARGRIIGEIIGTIRILYEDVHLSPEEILHKIIEKFSLKETDAKSYVEKALGVKLSESDLTAMEEPSSSSSRI